MASGGSDLSTRMSAEDYRHMCEIAFQHFKKHKVEIADAITTVFPFLEILRDRGFITNEQYKEFRKNYKNQLPIPKVVYDVLSVLEEKFDLPLLEVLFSKVIMKNYTDLNGIRESFRDVIQREICHQASGEKSTKNLNTQLSLEQGTGDNSYQILSRLFPDPFNDTAITENGLSEYRCETEQINKKETDITRGNDELESQQANEQRAQESDPAESMDLRRSPISGKRLSKRVRIQEGPSGLSAKEQRPGAGSPAPAVGSGADVAGPVDLGKNPSLQKATRKRRKRQHPREPVNYHDEILPVTCGEIRGKLFKKKFEQGSTVKCIKTEDGNWFTPREFEVAGGYETSKNWKMNVRCGGTPLKQLMEEEKLPIPPGKYGKKKKLETSEVCEVCWYGEDVIRCGTCSRAFHGSCHLPPVETERRPWSCTLCRIKEFTGRQPVYHASEVLKRPMGPVEQLKCEFLLLEIYCHPDSCCLEIVQQDNYPLETFKGMDNSMMLNKIKKNLSERRYPCVEGFVRDMRLIFQSHRAFHKDHALYLMGIKLEAKFEQRFKDVFAI